MTYASVSTMRPPATPSGRVRKSILPMRKRASWSVSTGSTARSITRGYAAAVPISAHPLNQMRPRGAWLEWVAEVLGLVDHHAISELHDADGIGRLAVVGEDEFGDPEVAGADDAAHVEPLAVRLHGARGLDVATAPDPLTRLRVFEHRVVSVNVVLNLEVVCVRGGPVTIECLSNCFLSHRAPPVPGHRGKAHCRRHGQSRRYRHLNSQPNNRPDRQGAPHSRRR